MMHSSSRTCCSSFCSCASGLSKEVSHRKQPIQQTVSVLLCLLCTLHEAGTPGNSAFSLMILFVTSQITAAVKAVCHVAGATHVACDHKEDFMLGGDAVMTRVPPAQLQTCCLSLVHEGSHFSSLTSVVSKASKQAIGYCRTGRGDTAAAVAPASPAGR